MSAQPRRLTDAGFDWRIDLVGRSNHTNLHFLLGEMDFEERGWDLQLLHLTEARLKLRI